MKVAGFDIGGANTDLAVIDFEDGEIKNIEVDFAYLPMWSNNDDLSRVLVELIEKICPLCFNAFTRTPLNKSSSHMAGIKANDINEII